MNYHIALDFDGVICDFHAGVCEVISRDFGVDVTEANITSWNMGEALDHHIGRGWWDWMRDHSKLWGEKFKPVTGALGSIEKLRAEGHLLEIVTSKPKWAEGAFWQWMARYEPPVQRVTIVTDKESKADATAADILVDDNPGNCESFARAAGIGILFNRPHNASIQVAEDLEIYRAANWKHVMEVIEIVKLEDRWSEHE